MDEPVKREVGWAGEDERATEREVGRMLGTVGEYALTLAPGCVILVCRTVL